MLMFRWIVTQGLWNQGHTGFLM